MNKKNTSCLGETRIVMGVRAARSDEDAALITLQRR